MIAETVTVAADRGQAIGIDDLAANAAVAATPAPGQRAWRVAGRRHRGEHEIAEPHLLAFPDDAVDPCRRGTACASRLGVVGAGRAGREDLAAAGEA